MINIATLSDKQRLSEIYRLRVSAYEDSPYSKFINRQLYPDGYYDELDEADATVHWIVNVDDHIVGSVRAVVMHNTALLKEDVSKLQLPGDRPFAFCGRTVVHPNFRKLEVMSALDKGIIQFLSEDPAVKFGLCYVTPERSNAVKRLGFENIGTITYDWGNNNFQELAALVWRKRN